MYKFVGPIAAYLRPKIVDLGGFDSSRSLILRGEIPRPRRGSPGKFEPTNLSFGPKRPNAVGIKGVGMFYVLYVVCCMLYACFRNQTIYWWTPEQQSCFITEVWTSFSVSCGIVWHRVVSRRIAPRRTAPRCAAPHRPAPHRTAPHRPAPRELYIKKICWTNNCIHINT